eukprot:1499857-Alexandrium_andersonii.AAC.1
MVVAPSQSGEPRLQNCLEPLQGDQEATVQVGPGSQRHAGCRPCCVEGDLECHELGRMVRFVLRPR